MKDLQSLIQYLSIPSISTDPKYKDGIKKTALWLEKKLKSLDLEVTKRSISGSNPVVIAKSKIDKNKPTLLVYGHYDVQPVEPLSDWKYPPFKPTVVKNSIYARGTSDNKGQFYSHILALEKIKLENKPLPVNLIFLVEGEEEIGSPNLEEFIKKYFKKTKIDVVWITDGLAQGKNNAPTINISLRGSVKFTLTLYGAKTDLHSGSYGGAIPNPANILTQVANSLLDNKTGKINISGFYDKVIEKSPSLEKVIKKCSVDERTYLTKTGVAKLDGEVGYTAFERTSIRPTLQITGIQSGYTGKGYKNIIPAWASMKVNLRTVPNQNGKEIKNLIIKHFKRVIPKTMKYELEFSGVNDYFLMNENDPIVKKATKALKKAFSQEPIIYLEGGTLPATSYFKNHLRCPILLTGWAQDMHIPNEKIKIDLIKKGSNAILEFWKQLNNEA